MRNPQVESDLKHLDAPDLPADLRARCLAAVRTGAPSRHIRTQRTPAWRAQRLALAGGLLLVTALGSAFWNTRPPTERGQKVSGGVAFAQTVEEMRSIKAFHIVSKMRNTQDGGWQSKDWSETEAWFDEERGAYSVSTNSPYGTALLPAHYAKTITSLALPDGTYYERGNSQFVVEKNAKQWAMMKEGIKDMLLGGVATTSKNAGRGSFAYDGTELESKPEEASSWQGKDANLFIFEQQPPNTEAYRKSPAFLKKIYVDAATNRVIANQEFAVFEGKEPQLLSQMEVDYETPDEGTFDPAKIKEGAAEVPRSNPYPHP